MKKLLLGALLLLSMLSFGQTSNFIKIENDIFSFNTENSQGVEQIYKFNVSKTVLDTLKTRKCFVDWKTAMATETLPSGVTKLKALQDEFPKIDISLIYLRQNILIQNLLIKYNYKNPSSFKIVENSKGNIYFSKNELTIYQNCSAKNGYGNDIPSTIFYILNSETCKFKNL